MNDQSEHIISTATPLEILQCGQLKQQNDGTLQFSYQAANTMETRFFTSEAKFKRFLQHSTAATIWQIEDHRSEQSYFYYYAWGEYSRYNNSNELYSDIASGTEAGVFSIKAIDNGCVHYYQQKCGWFRNEFIEVAKTEAEQLIASTQKSAKRQAQALTGLAFAAAVVPSVTALSKACLPTYPWAPESLLSTRVDLPVRYLASAIAFSSLYCLQSKLSWAAPSVKIASIASALTTLPQYATANGPVGNEFAVNSYLFGAQTSPAISAFADGGFVVTWQSAEQDGSGFGIYGKQFTSDQQEVAVPTSGTAGAVGNEFPINSFTIGSQNSPVVASLSDGGFVVIWSSNNQDGSGLGIYGKHFSGNGTESALPTSATGGAIDNEFPVNTFTVNSQNWPTITSLVDGGFVVAWQSFNQNGADLCVYGKRFAHNGTEVAVPSSGTKGARDNEFPINSYSPSAQHFPALASLADGGFVVIWQSFGQDGSNYGLYGKRFTSSGAEVTLPTSGTFNAEDNEFPINRYTIGNQDLPAIASLLNGGFVVTWQSNAQDGSGLGVYGKQYAATGHEVTQATSGMAGALDNEFPVNSYTVSSQGSPKVATLLDGGFVVTWQSFGQDGSGFGVYGKRFTENGAEATLPTSGTRGAEENEFPVNDYTTNNQFSAASTSLSNGGFAITWASDGQDNSGSGVYGKRFDANGQEMSFGDSEMPSSATEPASAPPAKTSSNNTGIAVGLFVAICCASGLATAIAGYLFRKKLISLYYKKRFHETNFATANVTSDNYEMPGQMSYSAATNKNTFENMLASYELYDDQFYLLTTVNAIIINEIYEKTGFKFSIAADKVDTSGIIASGHFGETQFAFDINSKQFVLCKMIKGKEACQSSKHEAKVHNLVSNKAGIIQLIRFGDFTSGSETNIRYVHFLEYANFGNGDDLVRRLQQIQDSTIKHKILVEIARQLLVALTSLLDASVCHFDLKTSNIVAHLAPTLQNSNNIEVKLIDFGCSKHLPDGQTLQGDLGSVSTFSWLRSNYHKARAHNFPVEPFDAFKEDLWALGLIIFELASGRDPKPIFDAENAIFQNPTVPIPAATFENNKRKLTELANASTDSIYHLADQLLTVEAKERPDARTMLSCSLFSTPSFSSVDEKAKAIAALKSAKINASTPIEKAQSYYRDGKHAYDRHYSNVGAAAQAMLFATRPYSNLPVTKSMETSAAKYY